ncbi:MAG: hypothetical protein LLG14_27490 [Nocardiaceae bacterium]|nr:hypothetical protein [Nocardiaceae bacterium]
MSKEPFKLGQDFVDRVTASDEESPSVIGAHISPMPSRYRRLKFEAAFQWKRLRVCLLCWWYLRHWPWGDLSTAEWRFQLDGETSRSAFLEGWCRMDDLGDKS